MVSKKYTGKKRSASISNYELCELVHAASLPNIYNCVRDAHKNNKNMRANK